MPPSPDQVDSGGIQVPKYEDQSQPKAKGRKNLKVSQFQIRINCIFYK